MSLNTIAASALSLSISETEGIHIMVMAALITVSGAVAVTGVVFVLLTAPLVAVAFRHQRTTKRASRAIHGAPHSAAVSTPHIPPPFGLDRRESWHAD